MDEGHSVPPVDGMGSAPKGEALHAERGRPSCADPAGCNDRVPDQGCHSSGGVTSFPSWMSPVRVRSPAVDSYGPFFPESNGATWTHEPAGEYHASSGISCSQLKDYHESPLNYYLRHVERSAPPKKSAALQRGSLFHLLCEHWPNSIDDLIAVAPDSVVTATGALSKSAEPWLAEIGDKMPTTPDELASVRRQFAEMLRNPAARTLLETSIDREFVIRWEWEGHPMRCRCDGATKEMLYDFKTTSDPSPLRTFHSSVAKWGYDLQSAVYGEAAVAVGMPPHRMLFVVTSNVFPHHCHVIRIPPEMIQRARQRALRYLNEIRQRTEWGHWLPDDYGEVTDLYVPYRRDF